MFDKILIANRGEIACRVIKTARRLGIRTVAVYSEADAGARHVRLADEAVLHRPGGGARVLSRRRNASSPRPEQTGAEAIHPGYGFLVRERGLRRGLRGGRHRLHRPAGAAIRAMGSKSRRPRR